MKFYIFIDDPYVEVVDEAETETEAAYLVGEYQMVYNRHGTRVWSKGNNDLEPTELLAAEEWEA